MNRCRGAGRGEYEPDEPGPAASAPRRGLVRLLIAALLVTAAVAAMTHQDWYQGAEARIADQAVRNTLGLPVVVTRAQHTMFFGNHGGAAVGHPGLQVALACSSDLLLAPFLLVVGGLLCVGRSSVRQVLTAAGLAVAIVVCMNVLRLVVIAAIVDRWGADLGVGRDHPLFGSVLTLLAMSVALVAYVFVLGRLSRFAVSGTEE